MATVQTINLSDYLQTAQCHKDFFKSVDRRLLFYGSKGSGKSYSVVDKLLLQPGIQSRISGRDIKLKSVVIRQSMPSLKRSCIELFQERSDLLQVPYHLNKSDFYATYANGSRVIFIGLDDTKAYQKLQSITNVDFVWIEELPEVLERTYENADLILRGGNGLYKQFIGTFNPVSIGSWVHRRWWEDGHELAQQILARAEDNRFIDPDYIQTLKDLEHSNYSLYTVYYLGQWGILKGVIYADNVDEVDSIGKYDEIIYGLDFGFNVPTALVKLYLHQIGKESWECYVEQMLYKTELTNSKLIAELKRLKINKNHPIYGDTAEPDRIQEIYEAGYNIHPSDKNVKDGIDFCKGVKFHYLKSATDVIKERAGYVWKVDKEGRPLDEPVKFQDHAMDAKRYGCYTHLKKFMEANVRVV